MSETTTPLKYSSVIEIACSVESAFAYVSDIATHPEWSPDNIRLLAAPDGGPRLGARYRTVGFSTVGRRDVEADLQVTTFEPPTRFGFVADNGQNTFENVFTFTRTEHGTRVERSVQFDAPPAVVERFKRLGTAEQDERREAALRMLKERLEVKRT